MELFRPLIFIKTLIFLRKKKPDIVIIGKTYQLSLAPLLACKLLSIPYIIRYDWLCPTNPKPTPCNLRQRLHCADCIGKVNKVSVPKIAKIISIPYFTLLQNIKKLLWNNAKLILAVSEYHKSIIQSFGIKGDLIKIAPNTIEVEYDEELVKNLSDKYHLSNSYNLLYVGRLEPEKGIEFLINGFEYMKKNHVIDKDIKLLIVGTGLLKKIVAEKSNKNDDIIYVGYIPHEEIGNYYALADVVVIPTIVPEGHPIVAEEAMSLEKPIIGLDMGGLHDIFEKYQKSIKIDNVDVHNLSNAIIEVYQKWGG
jgi:glycosyltransferase involved in cell wall biosynthesis